MLGAAAVPTAVVGVLVLLIVTRPPGVLDKNTSVGNSIVPLGCVPNTGGAGEVEVRGIRSRVGADGSSGSVAISEGRVAISDPSASGVVIAGSVPRRTNSKGVALGVIGACGGELSERPATS